MLAPRPVGVTVAGSQDIEAGASHACVISRDRRELRCWGYSGSGRLGIGPIEMAMPVREPSLVMGGLSWSSASLGWSHSCAIADGGHLYCFGYNIAGQLGMGGFDRASRVAPTEVAPIGSWTAVSSGETHTCAIRAGGLLGCGGYGRGAQHRDSCGRTDTSTPCRVCL
jgi:alpha-tubulin suppressor-like RCC1 family protein